MGEIGGGRVGFGVVIGELPDGAVCDPNACAQNGAPVCGANEVCQLIGNQLPCVQCVPRVGGQCTGQECVNGGMAACQGLGQECSLTNVGPACITCIAPNGCGNGRIDPLQPTNVDSGCQISGVSGQYCMPAGQVPADGGEFHPAHQCYIGAHCVNTNGQCAWGMTPSLSLCIQGAGGDPADAERWQFAQGSAPGQSPLLAQAAGNCQFPQTCTMDAQACCNAQGQTTAVGRDGCNNCQFRPCPSGYSLCSGNPNPPSGAPTCIRAGCNGELCVSPNNAPNVHNCSPEPTAACYAAASCALVNGVCGWDRTPALQQCLTDNTGSSCPTGQSCIARTTCAAQGGSAGNACGTGDTTACCSGLGPNNPPVEQCDDGNRFDGDRCGNDCQINCNENADCPEGACVEGQCVAQCALPPGGGGVDLGNLENEDDLHAAAGNFFLRVMAQEPVENFTLLP